MRALAATLGLAVLLAAAAPARALDPARAISQYSHQAWRAEDGLPWDAVRQLVQDRDGYLWLGTPAGVVRFDGVGFRTFDARNTPGMPSDRVFALEASADGSVWIGTTEGLLRQRGGRFESWHEQDGLPAEYVTALKEDRAGVLWIGTGRGLARFADGRLTRDAHTSTVRALLAARDGSLWVGTDAGALHVTGATRTRLGKAEGLYDERVTALAEDADGAIWIGTILASVSRVRAGRVTTFPPRTEQPDNSVRAILADRDRSVWVGTMDGLARLRPDAAGAAPDPDVVAPTNAAAAWRAWEIFDASEGLADDRVNSLLEDRERNLWVATNRGVELFRDGAFTTYTRRQGLTHDWTTTVHESRDGSLWVATRGGGFLNFAGGRFRAYGRGDGLISNYVRTIFEDAQGDVWAGTNMGLARLRGGAFTTFTQKDGLPRSDVVTLVPARAGGFWIGGQGGISRWDGQRLSVRFRLPPNAYARPVHEDRKGRIWYGGGEPGLARLEGEQVTRYGPRDGLGSNAPRAIHEDAQGTLWVGTQEGLARFRDERWSTLTAREGLADDDIWQVIEDAEGRLWMGGPKAIFHAPKAILEAAMDARLQGRPAHVTSTAYGTGDGLRSLEGSVDQIGRALTRDGRLWLTGAAGLATIDTRGARSEAATGAVPTPVLIEGVTINGRAHEGPGPALVPAGPRNLEVTYTALHFRDPRKLRFRHRLDGFDKDWIAAGPRRAATYTNLRPGAYRFRVSASTDDRVWTEAAASVNVTFAAAFHESRAFIPALAALLLLLATAAYWLRLVQVRARFSAVLSERNRMARELHDTLDQAFTAVALQLDVAERSSGEAARRPIALARDLLVHSQAEARRSIAELRSQALDGGNLRSALEAAIAGVTTPDGPRLALQVTGQAGPLPAAIENELLRIGQEALANALRHAQARHVDLELAFEPDRIRLTVKDDGRGFDPERAASEREGHFGLLGMRERAKRLGAELSLRSAPGQGTQVDVQVHLRR